MAVEVWMARIGAGVGGRGDPSPEHAGVLGATVWEREVELPKPFVTDRVRERERERERYS